MSRTWPAITALKMKEGSHGASKVMASRGEEQPSFTTSKETGISVLQLQGTEFY